MEHKGRDLISHAMYVRFDFSSSMSETLIQNRGCVSMSTSKLSRKVVIRQVHLTTCAHTHTHTEGRSDN